MMEKVYNAYEIYSGVSVGVIITKELKEKIEAEIVALLLENQDQCIAYDWTLNSSYEEDGKQVIIDYPSDFWMTARDRIKKIIGATSINLRQSLFTECEEREEVEELCRKVALGEVEPETWGA